MKHDLGVFWRHTKGQNLAFVRTPVAAFFTVGLPLVMLVLFVAMFGNEAVGETEYGEITVAQFYAPGLAVFAAASATYTNIGMNLSTKRDLGILKRVRGTPVPPWIYMTAVVLSGVMVAFGSMVLMVSVGVFAYGINIEAAKAPAMILAFVVGSATFATLGVAVAGVARTASSAQALTSATLLPLGFISNVFVSFGGDQPGWLEILGDVFPLKHFANSFGQSMDPWSEAPAIEWGHLAVLLAWLAFGAAVALKTFRWEPVPATKSARRQGSRRKST